MGKKMRIFLSVILFGLVMGGGYMLYINQTKETNKEIQVQSSKDEGKFKGEEPNSENENFFIEKNGIKIDLTKSTRSEDGISIYFEITDEDVHLEEEDFTNIYLNVKNKGRELFPIRRKSLNGIIGHNKGYVYMKFRSDKKEYLKETETITLSGRINKHYRNNIFYGEKWDYSDVIEFDNIEIPLKELRFKEEKNQVLNKEIMVGDVKVIIKTVDFCSEGFSIDYEAELPEDSENIEFMWIRLQLRDSNDKYISSNSASGGPIYDYSNSGKRMKYEYSAKFFMDIEQLDKVYIKEVSVQKQVGPRGITIDLEEKKIKTQESDIDTLKYFELYDFVEDDSHYIFRIKPIGDKVVPIIAAVSVTMKDLSSGITKFEGAQVIQENGEVDQNQYQGETYINYESILVKIDKRMMEEVDANKSVRIICRPEKISEKESCKIEISK